MFEIIYNMYQSVKNAVLAFFTKHSLKIKKVLGWLAVAVAAGVFYLGQAFSEITTSTVVFSALKMQWSTLVAVVTSFSTVVLWGYVTAWWAALSVGLGSVAAVSTLAVSSISALSVAVYAVLAGALITLVTASWSIVVNTLGYVATIASLQTSVYLLAVLVAAVIFYYSIVYLGDLYEPAV